MTNEIPISKGAITIRCKTCPWYKWGVGADKSSVLRKVLLFAAHHSREENHDNFIMGRDGEDHDVEVRSRYQ